MMDGINLYSIDYYKKTVFKGSYRGMCFRIGKNDVLNQDDSTGEGEDIEPVLRVQAWKGPYVLEKSDEEIFTQNFEYSEDGLKEANEWLESIQKEVVGQEEES